jgi:hypothetical protein
MTTISLNSAHDHDALLATLSAHWPQLQPALDRGVGEFDTHAHFTYSELAGIEVQNDQLIIHYRVHYHVYHPCRGLDVHDHCLRLVRAQLTSNGIMLTSYQPLPERSTADEL